MNKNNEEQLELDLTISHETLLQGMNYGEESEIAISADILEDEGFIFLKVGKDTATIPIENLNEVIEVLLKTSTDLPLFEEDNVNILEELSDEEFTQAVMEFLDKPFGYDDKSSF